MTEAKMETGKTKLEAVTWEIFPSVSPSGAMVAVSIDGGTYGAARIYLEAEQAFDFAAQLSHAAEWCKRKEAA